MVPSHALKHAKKTMCGRWSRQQLAGSYVGPSPFEQILPLQTCTWFLSSTSTGLDLTVFPIASFRRRNIFPTATNSLWQAAARFSTNRFMASGLFGQRSCPVLTLSVLAGSEGPTMKRYECHTVFSMFLPNRWCKFLCP